MTLTILGAPRTKKTSNRLVRAGNRHGRVAAARRPQEPADRSGIDAGADSVRIPIVRCLGCLTLRINRTRVR